MKKHYLLLYVLAMAVMFMANTKVLAQQPAPQVVQNDAATPSDLKALSVEFTKYDDFSANEKFSVTLTVQNNNQSEDFDAENTYGVYVFTDYTNGAKVATLGEETASGLFYANDIGKGKTKKVTFDKCTFSEDLSTGWYRIYAGAGKPTQRIEATYWMLYIRRAANTFLARIYRTGDEPNLYLTNRMSFVDGNNAVPHKNFKLKMNITNYGGHFNGELAAFAYEPNTYNLVGMLGKPFSTGIMRYMESEDFVLVGSTDIAPGTYDVIVKARKNSSSEWQDLTWGDLHKVEDMVLLDDEDPDVVLTSIGFKSSNIVRGENNLTYSLFNDGGSFTGQIAAFLTAEPIEQTRCSQATAISVKRKQSVDGVLPFTLSETLLGGEEYPIYLMIRKDDSEKWRLIPSSEDKIASFILPLREGKNLDIDTCY